MVTHPLPGFCPDPVRVFCGAPWPAAGKTGRGSARRGRRSLRGSRPRATAGSPLHPRAIAGPVRPLLLLRLTAAGPFQRGPSPCGNFPAGGPWKVPHVPENAKMSRTLTCAHRSTGRVKIPSRVAGLIRPAPHTGPVAPVGSPPVGLLRCSAPAARRHAPSLRAHLPGPGGPGHRPIFKRRPR